jgi:predicted ester cyclase
MIDRSDPIERLLNTWMHPPPDDTAALAALRQLYTDPVDINGVATSVEDLLERLRMMHRTYTGLRHELLDRVETPDRLVIAFRMHATHTGPLGTPLGDVAATGRTVQVRVIDVLTLTEGRISRVVMVADDLALLHGLHAVALTPPP